MLCQLESHETRAFTNVKARDSATGGFSWTTLWEDFGLYLLELPCWLACASLPPFLMLDAAP